MFKQKYIYILTFIVLALIAFRFHTSVIAEERDNLSEENPDMPAEKPGPAAEIKDLVSGYDSIISAGIKEAGTVGAAVVITYKNEIVYLKCFGVRKVGENDSVNKNTVFRLASVSKPVTGVLAGILSDEGTVKLDDKVIDYLPSFSLKKSENTNLLTIENLLSHTSGLVPHAYDNLIEEHFPLEKVMEKLKDVDISASPGKLYGYQNVMFSLYDTIVSIKTSKTFRSLLSEKVFHPFGMYDASASYEAFKKNSNKAYPHYGNRGKFLPLKLNNRYYTTAPAAGINASISDMSQFLLTLLDENSETVNDNIRNIIFTPRIKSPLKRNYFRQWDKIDSKHYSIGWRIVNYKNRKIAYHGGYVRGYRSEVAICEEEDIGIAFLSNSPNSFDSKPIPTFLNMIFDFKDKKNLQTAQKQ